MNEPYSIQDSESIREKVRRGYGQIARSGASCCSSSFSCCGSGSADQLAKNLGYQEMDLSTLPEGVNMGLSCGNPTALALLQEGEVVLDLGSGAGFDVFVAARKVGSKGKVIGVDMTPEMITKARRALKTFHSQTGLSNVEFRLGEIEYLPVADSSIQVVLSNCVLNLSPNKPQVWREIARVLRPGGRVAISDMALLKPLPDELRLQVELLVGCVAGAVLVEETRAMMLEAGLMEISLVSHPEYVNAMTDWSDPLYRSIVEHLPSGTRPGDYITSLAISAKKPG